MSREGTTLNHRVVFAILAAALAVIGLVGYRGDFPLSDDWSYAFAVRSWCETGRIELLPWTGASVVFQAAYGAALCKLFGLSFTVLRLSTLAIAATGAVAFWLLLAELNVRGRVAVLVMAACMLSPLYVNLSFTFMTDVPFTALAVVAGYHYAKGLGRGRARDLLLGSLVCAASLLVRQHGIFIAAAAALAALLDTRTAARDRLTRATASAAVPLVTLLGYFVWLYAFHGAPSAVGNKISEATHASFAGLANITFRAVEYLGLLLLPLAAAVAPGVLRRRRGAFLATLALLAAGAVVLYVRERTGMFYLTNVLYDFGLGALSLRDVHFLGLPRPVHVGAPLSAILTLLSTLGAAVLIAAWSAWRPMHAESARTFVALAALLLFLGSLLHAGFYFDRYLLPVLPFAAAALACAQVELRTGAASFGLALALAWYAIAGTHDYMEWNRARFELLAELEKTGTDPRSIDGGVEYNGWRLAPVLGTWPTTEEARTGQPATRRSWWWVADDRYVVSFRALDGYALKAERQYPRWLAPGYGRVLLLEREAGASP